MATHVAAWFENQDGAATLQPLAALADTLSPVFVRDANADLIRVDPKLRYIAGIHAHVDATVQPRCRLNAPSLKTRFNGRTTLEVPVLSSVAEPLSPPAFNDWRAKPVELDASDLLGFDTINDPAAAADQFIVVFFSDGPVQPVDTTGGFWARYITTAAAATANVWNSRSLTPDETLRPGTYEVLGMRAISTTCIAARLVFPLGGNYRPGVLGCDARADILAPAMLPGQMGSFGIFAHDAPPTAEFLLDAADNEVQVVDLFIRPTRSR